MLRQDVNLVNVLFSVFDKNNKVIGNLGRGDFQIFDDKMHQDIRSRAMRKAAREAKKA